MGELGKHMRALAVFSVLVLTVGACAPAAPAATPTSAPAKPTAAAPTTAPATGAQTASSGATPAWQAEWDKTVAAAKNEKLVIVTHPGGLYQKMIASFKAAYPDIPVEHSGERPSEISPKIITEQKNGVYNWDVMVASTSNMNDVLLPAGAFQELPPFFIRDDFRDDSKWGGGKFGMYTSDKGPFVLIHNFDLTSTIFINRDLVPREKLSKSEDLLKPEFAGKIVMDHPNVPAHGSLALTGLLNGHGEDFINRVFTEAKPVIQDNVRITTEWVATGRYPIGIGVDLATLLEFQGQGIGKNVERFTDDPYLLAQGLAVFKNAPHSNAAKVFVNWFLTQQGQQAWADSGVTGNSRRLDVAPQMPDAYPDYSQPLTAYSIQGTDSGAQLMTQIQGIYKKYQTNQ